MKPQRSLGKYGLCIDWETSGADFGKDSSLTYQGIAFAAGVFDTDTFQIVEELYLMIKFDKSRWKWTKEAEEIHGISIQQLNEKGIPAEDAAIKLAELILKYWGPDSKVLFLGHNATFDIRFTNQLLNEIGFEISIERKDPDKTWIQLHHVILDTSSAGYVVLGLYKSDNLFEKIGFKARGKHSALEDMRQTVQTCEVLRTIGKQFV